jgi:hypothetical protein
MTTCSPLTPSVSSFQLELEISDAAMDALCSLSYLSGRSVEEHAADLLVQGLLLVQVSSA